LFPVSSLEFWFWCEGNDARHHQASETAQKGPPVVKLQPIEVPIIPFSELKEATDDFGSNSLIGEGSYGRVYYGVLNNDLLPSAIKKLDSNKQPDNEFLAQVLCGFLLLLCYGHINVSLFLCLRTWEILTLLVGFHGF